MYWQCAPEQEVELDSPGFCQNSYECSDENWAQFYFTDFGRWYLHSVWCQIHAYGCVNINSIFLCIFLRQWVVFSPRGHCESERFAVTWWVTSCTHSYYKFLCRRPHKISVVFKIDHKWDLNAVQTFLETLCVLVMLTLREWVSLQLWVIGLKLQGEVLWPLLCMRSEQNDADGLFQPRNTMKYCRGLVRPL